MQLKIHLKTRLGFVLILTILSGLTACFASGNSIDVSMVRGKVFWKISEKPPFELTQGSLEFQPDMSILSFFDGQCFFNLPDEREIRLKEDTVLVVHDFQEIELRKGLVGLKTTAGPLKIFTPHAGLNLEKGTVVIKVNPIMTRISVVKGGVYLLNESQKTRVLIPAGKEVAVASGMFSKIYDQTPELRYTWYWVEPSKEPGLRLE